MFDPDQVPLSTSEGRRPSSTAGDRLIVGLAALALLGGVLIAVSRFLPEQTEPVTRATATPSASPEGSPAPEPTLRNQPVRTMQVDTAQIPSPSPQPDEWIGGWVRMKTDITLQSSPASSVSHPAGVLHRGDAAYVSEVPASDGGVDGWLQVQAPRGGWILGEFDNDAMFERFPYRWRSASSIHGLAANRYGFTGFGYRPGASGELTLSSADGLHWQTSTAPAASWGRSIAEGPAGLLMVGNAENGMNSWSMVWESADGRSWQPIGVLPEEANGNVSALAGSDAGYVLLTGTGGGRSGLWYSADGLLWTERPVAMGYSDVGKRIAATPLGFVVWSDTSPGDEAGGAFSADGWTWSEAAFPGMGQVIDVVADGDHLLALGRGSSGGLIWEGTIDQQQQLAWAPGDSSPFRDAKVSRMVSDGQRAVVLGWEPEPEIPVWWQHGADVWQRHAMPTAFAALPRDAAGGPPGIVVVDQSDSPGVASPVIWHLSPGSEWMPEPSPLMPSQPPPSSKMCGPTPDDLLALLSIDGTLAADCFGSTPITVRGWSSPCEGCYGRSPGIWQAKWLASPGEDRLIHLSPMESADWGTVDAVRHPALRGPAPRASRWLEVTGHFDDPEAASCRWTPTVADEQWYSGTADVIAGCRARFVITSIHRVDGP